MSRQIVTAITTALVLNTVAHAADFHFNEDFSSDPSARWQVFGNQSLFQWDSGAGNLRVTWDSSQPKSFFHIPLPRTINRYDSFSFEFDLVIQDIASGHEEGKTGPMQIGIGFLNTGATNDSWSRVEWPLSANVAEFNCYPSGYYPGWPVEATTAPGFVSASGYSYAPKWLDDYVIALPLNTTVRIQMRYAAEDQTLRAVWTTNGVPVDKEHILVLSSATDSQFSDLDDYYVNVFSISSYQSRQGEYADSVLAHGSVDNLQITIPPSPPICRMQGAFDQGSWEVRFHSLTGWSYALDRSQDLKVWTPVQEDIPGNGSFLVIEDQTPPTGHACYRVRATQK